MIAIGCDHAGYDLKEQVIEYFKSKSIDYKDFGCYKKESDDYYTDFAKVVSLSVASGESEKGILICGTGIGMSIAANKVRGIRAALCTDSFVAKLSREHNNANILALGARITGSALSLDIIQTFIDTKFSNDDRHIKRIGNIE